MSHPDLEGCSCKWIGEFIIAFDRECPNLEAHKDRLMPERILVAIRRHALDSEASELRGFVLGVTARWAASQR